MLLSEAIDLGRTIQPGGSGWSFCDCALGMAMAAVGIPREKRGQRVAVALWPWIRTGDKYGVPIGPIIGISGLYFSVARGEITMDQLIEKVRAMEPQEPQEQEVTDVVNVASAVGSAK